MRVLAVGNMYPPHHLGGYEIAWQGAMRRATAAGHDVRVLTSDHRSPDAGPEVDADVHRELEWYWSYVRHEWQDLTPRQRLALERRNSRVLRRHLDEFSPDVISWWAMGAMSLSLLEQARRVPSLLVVHDDWLVYGPRRDAWMRLWSGERRLLAPLAGLVTRIPTRFRPARSKVLTNSNYVLRRAREHGVELDRAEVVTPGIEPRFQRATPPEPWHWRLLYVGRLDRQKGVDVAVTALTKLPPETTLTIAGSGDFEYEAELRSQAERLGLVDRVEFAGQAPREQLPALYASADAVVFPVRWEEPWGLVPLEAMGIGRPVVATARGGAVEYLRDGSNALVFPFDDADALAAAVWRLGAEPDLRARLCEGGFATAAEHTAGRFEDRILAELEDAAGV